MLFREVVGQEVLKNKIRPLAQRHQLPHAMLFLGRPGTGGLPMALATAQYILCEQAGESDSCHTCASCIKVEQIQHPDLHFSFPFSRVEKKEPLSREYFREFREFILQHPYGSESDWLQTQSGGDKKGNITADECRDILRRLQLKSYEGGPKILILWMPERLGQEGNILLKFLEEPTPNTIMILVAENEDVLLPTIRSRVQLFPLRRLSDEEIREALIRLEVQPEHAGRLSRIAEGDFHQALHLLHDQDSDYLQMLRNWLNALFRNNGPELAIWIRELSDKKVESRRNFLQYVIQLLEHTIRLGNLGPAHVHLPEDEARIAHTLLQKGIDSYRLGRMAEMVGATAQELERNVNAQIALHALSLRVQQAMLATRPVLLD